MGKIGPLTKRFDFPATDAAAKEASEQISKETQKLQKLSDLFDLIFKDANMSN